MKDFKDWGIKVRALKDYNYRAMWMNLKTIRFGESINDIVELPPSLSEFYAMQNVHFVMYLPLIKG